jgi:hypothetical protein
MGSRVGAMIAGMKQKGSKKGLPKLGKGDKEIKVKGFKPLSLKPGKIKV